MKNSCKKTKIINTEGKPVDTHIEK